jgi:hypothetical protein
MRRCFVLGAMLVAWLLLFGSTVLVGQTTFGSIVGRATDQSGGVIAGAQVVLRNEATNVTASTQSNTAGDYVFSNLIPGTYEVSVTSQGFERYVLNHIVLYVNQTAREDATLTVGGVTQSIQVTAELPLVQTQTSEVAGVIDSNQITSMPLNGRTNLYGLLTMVPGVQNAGSNPQIAGNQWSASTRETMDGVTFMEVENQRLADASPSLESIGQFKVVDSTGSAGGGQEAVQVITATKSGTNQFHGTAFEYNRVAATEAANYFATSLPKPPFIRNEYGASLGGPIKRDKVFFFGSFEGFKYLSSATAETAQPTPALLQGDFTGLPTITDPSTGLPFPNNRIPQNEISSTSSAFFKYFDTPNLPSTAPGGLGTNYVVNIPNVQDNNRFQGRVDYNINEANTLSVRYFMVRQIPQNFAWGSTEKMGSILWPDVNQNLAINYTRILTPKLVNLATFGWSRETDTLKSQNYNFDTHNVIPAVPASLPGNAGLPTFTIYGFNGISDWGGGGDTIPTYEFHDTLTWVKSSHTVKGGFDWYRWQFFDYGNGGDAHGAFTFTGRYTGNPFADYLLGDISADGYPLGPSEGTPTEDRYSGWIQDNWKATKHLTVTLGLRVDLPSQFENTGSGQWMTNWYPNTNQVVVVKGTYDSSLWGNLPIVKGSDAGINNGNYVHSSSHQVTPRVGLAYSPLASNRVVLRGGYGIYYTPMPSSFGPSWEGVGNPPFAGTFSFEPQAGTTPSLTFANPVPSGTGAVPLSGIGLGASQQNYKLPESHEWNFTAESQISAHTSVRASYLGNESEHMYFPYNINDPVPAPGPVQPRRPYQPWSSISYYNGGETTNCQELQLSLQRRFSTGLSFEVEYAWTKWLTNGLYGQATPTDNQNIRLDRGNYAFIAPQYVVANYNYELPFGKGKRFLSSADGALNQVVGGWQTTGIITISGGKPYSVTFDSSTEGWPSSRADIIGSPHVGSPSLSQWFNPAAYAVPQPFAWGDSAPNSLFGPGFSNWDMGIFKIFPLKERIRLQFRAELFNWLNHPSFSNPASDISVPSQVGQIFSTSSNPRSVQFSLRLEF